MICLDAALAVCGGFAPGPRHRGPPPFFCYCVLDYVFNISVLAAWRGGRGAFAAQRNELLSNTIRR